MRLYYEKQEKEKREKRKIADAYLQTWQNGPWKHVLKREFNPTSFPSETMPPYYKDAQLRKLQCLEYACKKLSKKNMEEEEEEEEEGEGEGEEEETTDTMKRGGKRKSKRSTHCALKSIFKEDIKKFSSEYLLDQITNIFINLSFKTMLTSYQSTSPSNTMITLIDKFGRYLCHRFVNNFSCVFNEETKKYESLRVFNEETKKYESGDSWEILSLKPQVYYKPSVNQLANDRLKQKAIDMFESMNAERRHAVYRTIKKAYNQQNPKSSDYKLDTVPFVPYVFFCQYVQNPKDPNVFLDMTNLFGNAWSHSVDRNEDAWTYEMS